MGGTNDYEYSFTPPVYTTNDLWLEITGKTNTRAYLTIHEPWNVTNGVYDLYYTTNLSAPESWSWVLRSFAGVTNLVVNNATDAQGFYRLGPLDDPVGNDSLGTNFWLTFYSMDVYDFYYNYIPPTLSLYISSPVGASGYVVFPANGGVYGTNTFTVTAGAVTNVSLPPDAMLNEGHLDVVENSGIHVFASQPVSVYAMDYFPQGSAAFTGYPTTLLGTNYCVMARPGWSEFAIVATADNTTATITPSPTADLAGSSWRNPITMQRGQTYQDQSNWEFFDVTGTRIESDKPIAVFAGAWVTGMPYYLTGAANPLVQQQLPVESWGTQALALSFGGRTNGDSYRVLAAYSNTVVTITGTVVTIVAWNSSPFTVTKSNEMVVTNLVTGQFCDIIVEGPVEFQASQPIQVAQFANGYSFDNPVTFEGDPCDIIVLPTGPNGP